MHPILYVFPPDVPHISHEIITRSAACHPEHTVFFLHDMQESKSVKIQMQRNEARLNLQCIQVYVVVQACCTAAASFTAEAVQSLQDAFAGDFKMLDFTLCVLLYESPASYDWEQQNHETRVKSSQAFLLELNSAANLYHRIYLLSDRNENDTIHPNHLPLLYETLVHLPLAHHQPTRLFETINAKIRAEEQPLFYSAGIAMVPLPKPEEPTPIPELPELSEVPPHATETIIQQMISLPSNPCSILHLRNLTTAQGEAALYSNNARRFFEAHYLLSDYTLPFTPYPDTPHNTRRISSLKQKIAEAYARQYEAHHKKNVESLHRQREATRQKNEAKARRKQRKYQEALEGLFAAIPPYALSLTRRDALMEEVFHFHHAVPCVLRIVGGFPLSNFTL